MDPECARADEPASGARLAERARPAAGAAQKLPRNVETAMTSQPQTASRENILHRVRTALGRSAAQPPADPPPVRLRIPEVDIETRIATMMMRIEALAGKTYRVSTEEEACALVAQMVEGKAAVASNSPYLAECGVTRLTGVTSGISQVEELRTL